MIPNPIIVRTYAVRGATCWIGTRLVVSILFALAQTNPLRLSPIALVTLILLSVAVCFIATLANRERALLGNLGVSWSTLATIFAIAAILCEAALYTVVRAIA